MAENPPYISSPGTIASVLRKIQPAQTPDKFTYDFLEKTLGLKGGSPKSFIPFAKKIGLLASDGTPTELYKQFRVEGNSSKAIAKAMRIGYKDIFSVDENAHKLTGQQLESVVIQITGKEKGSSVVKLIVGCFNALKDFADFSSAEKAVKAAPPEEKAEGEDDGEEGDGLTLKRLNLAYTINLNLPETTNVAVFNAIFKSLKENLLQDMTK